MQTTGISKLNESMRPSSTAWFQRFVLNSQWHYPNGQKFTPYYSYVLCGFWVISWPTLDFSESVSDRVKPASESWKCRAARFVKKFFFLVHLYQTRRRELFHKQSLSTDRIHNIVAALRWLDSGRLFTRFISNTDTDFTLFSLGRCMTFLGSIKET